MFDEDIDSNFDNINEQHLTLSIHYYFGEKPIINPSEDFINNYGLQEYSNTLDDNYFLEHKTPQKIDNLVEEDKSTEETKLLKSEDGLNYPKPESYPLKNIKEIFNKDENKNKFQEIQQKISDKDFESDMNLLNKKRKNLDFEKNDLYIELSEKGKKPDKRIIKKGNNFKSTESQKKHDKLAADNVIKKVKGELFKYPIKFINKLINENMKEQEIKFLKLSYKYINRLKKEQDLEYLKMPLKDFLSKEISSKYSTKLSERDFNKKLIENILKNEKDNTILFALNMSFKNLIDILTLKKSVKEVVSEYENFKNKEIDYEKIKRNIGGVDELLKKIMNKISKEHLTHFIYYLYNYESYFYNKKGRKRNPKN